VLVQEHAAGKDAGARRPSRSDPDQSQGPFCKYSDPTIRLFLYCPLIRIAIIRKQPGAFYKSRRRRHGGRQCRVAAGDLRLGRRVLATRTSGESSPCWCLQIPSRAAAAAAAARGPSSWRCCERQRQRRRRGCVEARDRPVTRMVQSSDGTGGFLGYADHAAAGSREVAFSSVVAVAAAPSSLSSALSSPRHQLAEAPHRSISLRSSLPRPTAK
jgi:hypothetical protein